MRASLPARADLLDPRGVGNAAGRLGFLAGAHLLLDGGAHGLKVEAHLLEHAHGDPLPQLDQAEQNMLGAGIIMVETVRFLAGQGQHLLRPWREIVHRLLRHVGIRGLISFSRWLGK